MASLDIAILTGWHVYKSKDSFFISSTHFVYLEYVAANYRFVYLITPVSSLKNHNIEKTFQKIDNENIRIIELPYYEAYKNAVRLFFRFLKTIKQINKNVDLYYCRVPDPFSWVPKLIFRKKCIMHYVGDAVEVIWTNQNFSVIKKIIYIILYLPEYLLTLFASRFSIVFTNGFHLAHKLRKWGIKARPVISSTIKINDFLEKKFKPANNKINLLYVGYLRHSKGVETLIEAAAILNKMQFKLHLNIVGNGEAYEYLKLKVDNLNLSSVVNFLGHIDDRKKLIQIYQENDIFVFASLSEGSPRVIIEAMALSLPIVSTPVGALPMIFENGTDLIFAETSNAHDFAQKIKYIIMNPEIANKMITTARNKVMEKYTIDKFLGEIFQNES